MPQYAWPATSGSPQYTLPQLSPRRFTQRRLYVRLRLSTPSLHTQLGPPNLCRSSVVGATLLICLAGSNIPLQSAASGHPKTPNPYIRPRKVEGTRPMRGLGSQTTSGHIAYRQY